MMNEENLNNNMPAVERQAVDADIVCVGFGPAVGGFLTTISKELVDENGMTKLESKVMPGMPLQILCYERADDLGFGVSGVVTKAKAIKESFPDLNISDIPLATEVKHEKTVYLLDPKGASKRPGLLKFADSMIKGFKWMLPYNDFGFELPFTPPFLNKHGGLLLSIGQFNQWVGSQIMMSGMVQIWPGSPVDQAIIEDNKVKGVRLTDQGVEKNGEPTGMYMPGMDVHADLTVVGDGPIGPVGRQLDTAFKMPEGKHKREWAVGMKFTVDLPENCPLEPGTVIHTMGYPEPEIFGFMYVYPDKVASLGIFVTSHLENPARTAYRYLQHWMKHPYLWKYLDGGTLRSWGAKTIAEWGKQGEPQLAGDGFARIGEGSGSTNILTNSGVDEAWYTGKLLAEAVIELAKEGKPYTKENLDATYIRKRRESRLESEGKQAQNARNGFNSGFITGVMGMGLAGITGGALHFGGKSKTPYENLTTPEQYYAGKIKPEEIAAIREECKKTGKPLHDALMDKAGWETIEYDGKLLISHQDALLLGGKVQAAGGYADHVEFLYPNLCEECGTKVCVEFCSGQAITMGENGVPNFDREKCVHCGACLWNCAKSNPDNPEQGNIVFKAGSGGLHSAEN